MNSLLRKLSGKPFTKSSFLKAVTRFALTIDSASESSKQIG